jgi:hypothetical protein
MKNESVTGMHRCRRANLEIRVWFMRIRSTITVSAMFTAVIMSSGCSRKEPADTPHVTITASQGTNVMTITNKGYTFKVGGMVTNESTKPR